MPGVKSAYKEVGLRGNEISSPPRRRKQKGWGLYSAYRPGEGRLGKEFRGRCNHITVGFGRCRRYRAYGFLNCFGHGPFFRRKKVKWA